MAKLGALGKKTRGCHTGCASGGDVYLGLVVVVGQCGTHHIDPLAPKCSNQVLCSDMAPLGGGGCALVGPVVGTVFLPGTVTQMADRSVLVGH